MSKQRKVIRTKTLYKRHRFPKKAASRLVFFLLILVLVGIGFIVMREWSARFGNGAQNQPPSSASSPSSVAPPPISSETPVSSEEPQSQVGIGKTGFISANDLLLAKDINGINALMEKVKNEGCSAVSIELKPQSGMLAYASLVPDAVQYGAVSENAVMLADIISAAKTNSLKPIAVISTFRDEKIPHVSRDNSYAYSTSLNVNWLDDSVARGGKPWLNPYMERARGYVCGISKEIAASGFEKIILENMMFPNKNTRNLNTIIETPSREEILNQALSEIEAAVKTVSKTCGVTQSVDIVQAIVAGGEEGLNSVLQSAGTIGSSPSLYISVSEVEKNKEAVCLAFGIVGQDGFDKNTPVTEVIKGMLSQNSISNVMLIMSNEDYVLISDILTELKLSNVIIK